MGVSNTHVEDKGIQVRTNDENIDFYKYIGSWIFRIYRDISGILVLIKNIDEQKLIKT